MFGVQCAFFTLLIAFASCFTDICNNHCENTFPLHTTDKVAEYQACLTGCRLKYVSQLTYNPFISSTTNDCTADCSSVFPGENEKSLACKVGCEASFPKEEIDSNPFEDFDLRWHVQLVQPFFMMKHYIGEASSYVHSSYVYEQSSNGNSFMISVQSTHEVMVAIHRKKLSPDDSFGKTFGETFESFEEKEIKDTNDMIESRGYMEQAYEHGSRWLNCVEKRSGIPYIHVVTVLLLSLLFVAWICCSSCDENDDEENSVNEKKHTFGKVFSINSGDIQLEKVPLFKENTDNTI